MALIFVLFFAASACASKPKKVDLEERAIYDAAAKEFMAHPSWLIVDACVRNDGIGDAADYVDISKSANASGAATDVFNSVLKQRGFEIVRISQPIYCAGTKILKGKPLLVAADGDAEIHAVVDLPLAAGQSLLGDDLALVDEIMGQLIRVRKYGSMGNHPYDSKLDKMRLNQLKAITGTDKVWFLSVRGQDLSKGKRVGTAVATSVISLVVSFGTRVQTDIFTDYTEYWVGLLDLDSGSVDWSSFGTISGVSAAETETYGVKWVDEMLEPLFLAP